jgi:hypothetical protein
MVPHPDQRHGWGQRQLASVEARCHLRLTKFIGCQSVSEWRAMQIKMSDYNRVSVGPVAELRMLAETRHAPR